jgi:hypothetical protein
MEILQNLFVQLIYVNKEQVIKQESWSGYIYVRQIDFRAENITRDEEKSTHHRVHINIKYEK